MCSECIKMHHFEGENTNIFPGTAPPQTQSHCGWKTPSHTSPVGNFGASIRVPPALELSQTTFLATGLLLLAN